MGALLTGLVAVVEDPSMPAWAALLHEFLGPWGIFTAFAIPAAILWLGFAFQWLDMLPAPMKSPIERALRLIFTFGMTVGLLAGGLAGSVLCFSTEHWFFGSLSGLVAIAGAAFSLAMMGASRIAAGLMYWVVVLVLFAGVPATFGYWTYESYLVGHQGHLAFGGILFCLWIAGELLLGVGYLQRKLSTHQKRS